MAGVREAPGGFGTFLSLGVQVLGTHLASLWQPRGRGRCWRAHGIPMTAFSRCQACDAIPGARPRWMRWEAEEGPLMFPEGTRGSPLRVENSEVLRRASNEFLTRCQNGSDHNSLFHVPLKGSSKLSLRKAGVGGGGESEILLLKTYS